MQLRQGRQLVAVGLVGLIGAAAQGLGGILYATSYEGSLSTIDTDTYAVNLVGSLGIGGTKWSGAAYDPISDRLLVVDGDSGTNLYSVNVNTALATLVGSHGISRMFGLTLDNTGTLYASQFHDLNDLYTLDKATAAATLVGSLTQHLGVGLPGSGVSHRSHPGTRDADASDPRRPGHWRLSPTPTQHLKPRLPCGAAGRF